MFCLFSSFPIKRAEILSNCSIPNLATFSSSQSARSSLNPQCVRCVSIRRHHFHSNSMSCLDIFNLRCPSEAQIRKFHKLSIETVILFRQTSLHPSPTTSPTKNHHPLLIRGTYTNLLSTGKASVEAAATRSPYASATVVPGYTTIMAGARVAMRWGIGLAWMVARVARIVEATSVRYMVR